MAATKKLSRSIRTPVTATRDDPCKATLPWHEICNLSTDSAPEASNIDITDHEIPAPATRKAFWTSKNVSRPSLCNDFDFQIALAPQHGANFAKLNFKVLRHRQLLRFCLLNRSRATTWCKFCEAQRPKVLRACRFLTILISKSLPRRNVVQILRSSTSKSAPSLPVFNGFDFQTALAPQRGANFCEAQLPKVLRTHGALTILASKPLSRHSMVQILRSSTSKSAPTPPIFQILTSKPLSRHSVVQILSTSWAADPPHHLAFRSWLCELSKPRNYAKTWPFAQNSYPPRSLMSRICAVKHFCCQTSMLRDLAATFRIVGG